LALILGHRVAPLHHGHEAVDGWGSPPGQPRRPSTSSGHDIRLWPRQCDEPTMTINQAKPYTFMEGTAVHTKQMALIEKE
jgi:hypothetical protein